MGGNPAFDKAETHLELFSPFLYPPKLVQFSTSECFKNEAFPRKKYGTGALL